MNFDISTVLDWVARIVAFLGTTGVTAFFARRKWRTRASRRVESVQADVEAATADDKIKTSSITQVEAQMVAMDRAFTIERTSLGRSIDFLVRENEDLHRQVEAKDARLREALGKIDELQRQLTELAEQVRADIQDATGS